MSNQENVRVDDLILIGHLSKPHGLSGEVKVKALTDFPSRFRTLKRVYMVSEDGDVREITIEHIAIHNGTIRIKFQEINSVDDVEAIIGKNIAVSRQECVTLPPDQYYLFDLIGVEVVLSHGETIGVVEDVHQFPAQDVLIVRTFQGNEVLIPFVKVKM